MIFFFKLNFSFIEINSPNPQTIFDPIITSLVL